MMEGWRYVWVECGAQYVMTDGMRGMLELCVDNWGIMEVSLLSVSYIYLADLFFPHQFPFLYEDDLYLQMIQCCSFIWTMWNVQEMKIC